MRIAFLWDWEPLTYQTITWQDGLAAALKELINRGHEVEVVLPGKGNMTVEHVYFPIQVRRDVVAHILDFEPDVILHWADMTRPHARELQQSGIPMAICFAGGEPISYNTHYFSHVFVESEVYKEVFKKNDVPVSVAFGTNTDLFKPMAQPILFDTIFPATFAQWKRHDLYAHATKGLRSLAVGYMYRDHETECWEECIRLGTTVAPHVSHEVLSYLYAASKMCVITSLSSGGSQRTVLEAMAMNLPVIVTDSDKFDFAGKRIYRCEPEAQEIRSYIQTILDGDGDTNTRDFILENWSHIQYADSLEKGLRSII